jgi:hypothetical protein
MTRDKAGRIVREPIPQSVRFNIFRRDNFACRYCGTCSGAGVTLHIDHAVSIKDGGGNDEANLITACSDCNYGKGAKSINQPPALASKPPIAEVTGLVGMYGYTLENDELQWQFKIIRQITPDRYLCQLFSWLDGEQTNCETIETKKLVEECKLFATNSQWLDYYEKHCERARYKRERIRHG